MDREFLDLYNKELQVLSEQAQEFAAEFPGIAGRLGGIVGVRSDPMVTGLLEGAAFLAARVQLKLKHEFPEFTANLIDQLLPNYLAPTPSALLARFSPPFANPALKDGRRIARDSLIEATYLEHSRRVACRFRMTADVTLWPFELTGAQYLLGAAPIEALGVPGAGAAAGLRLSLLMRSTDDAAKEPPDAVVAKQPNLWLSACRTPELPFHLTGYAADAVALYEQLFDERTRLYLRHLDGMGRTTVQALPADALQPLGFGEDEMLLPRDGRVFRGFELLREYFVLPRKFMGFRLTGLKPLLARIESRAVDVIAVFGDRRPSLAGTVGPAAVALYAAPAVNLFEKSLDRIQLRSEQHEYHVVADRTRWLEFEPHRLLDVYAHMPGRAEKTPVLPLYSAAEGARGQTGLFYTIRRVPRRRTASERRSAGVSDYGGTDMFLSLTMPAETAGGPRVKELSIRAYCSNRHLTEHLPVGETGADFRLVDDATLAIHCVDGPTRPREPVYAALRTRSETASTGSVAWRLVNMLSLNHLGLLGEGAGANAAALREILTLLIDPADAASERQVQGIRSVDSRPVVRRLRQRSGVGAARGTEVTVTVEESAFEGSGAFLIGAVLDRFFAEYAGVNHFTQTVIRTAERGEIKRWPPAHRPAAADVTDFEDVLAEPWRFDLLALLRALERAHPDKPRIGDSRTRREDIVTLGNNPTLEFPPSTIEAARKDGAGRLHLFVRFLGLLGPQGALPLATTEEAYWWLPRDEAFPRFLDLFNHRFIQLFFRAWADARPIAQADQPGRDRFSSYVGAAVGLGSAVFRDLDSVADEGKLAYAGLMAPQAKSTGRLEQVLAGLFGVRVEISEFIGSWLDLDRADQTRLGAANASLGSDVLMGGRVYSVQDKIRIRAVAPDLPTYRRFLPDGDLSRPLADMVFFYLGFALEWDLELALPAGRVEPMRLGQSGAVGWTSWVAPQWAVSDTGLRADVRLNGASLRRPRQEGAAGAPASRP